MTERERLRALVADLPEDEVHEALCFVEHLREGDPVLMALRNARADDEPVTQEDLTALEEAWEAGTVLPSSPPSKNGGLRTDSGLFISLFVCRPERRKGS